MLVLFGYEKEAAWLFGRARWADSVRCAKGNTNVAKFFRYVEFQRHTCKTCKKTFNDRTGTLLHYRRMGSGGRCRRSGCAFAGSPTAYR